MILYAYPIHIELLGRTLVVNKKSIHPSVRTFSELRSVMKEEPTRNGEAYYMYRNVLKEKDLRYDITVIPQWVNETESAKTYGHCHPIAEQHLSFPEVYQILYGEAIFLLQKELVNGDFFVSIVEGKKGDVLLIPPNFCHVTINAGTKDLILANVVADHFTPDYSIFKRNHGAAYYVMANGVIVQNSNYIILKNERKTPKEINKRYGFECSDLLTEFYTNPKNFDFLKMPSLLKFNNTDF